MKKRGEGPAWADEAEAREREMLLAVWCQVRLLFVGARDEGSPLSRLPPELVVAIARRAQVRPVCYATRWLDQIREAARKSPDGAVHMWTELSSLGRKQEDPPIRRGYVLEYRATPRHGRSRSSNTAKEQFTVHQWESTELWRRRGAERQHEARHGRPPPAREVDRGAVPGPGQPRPLLVPVVPRLALARPHPRLGTARRRRRTAAMKFE